MREGQETVAVPKQVELEKRLNMLTEELDELDSLSASIDSSLSRLGVGPHRDEATCGDAKEPDTYLDRLDAALIRLNSIRNGIGEASERLQRAI